MLEYLIASVLANVVLVPVSYCLLEKYIDYKTNYFELMKLYREQQGDHSHEERSSMDVPFFAHTSRETRLSEL